MAPKNTLHFLTFRDNCWSCGKVVLGLGTCCPHCGKKLSQKRKGFYLVYLLILLAALALVGLQMIHPIV